MANHDYDDLFDSWGRALNIDPQLGKTIFHVESEGNPNTVDGPESPYAPIDPRTGKRERAQGGMQMLPSTARAMAAKLGWTPEQIAAIDLRDMRYAVPLSMQYLADGLNAHDGDVTRAVSYYYGGPDQTKWGPKTAAYVAKAGAYYPNMALTDPNAPKDEPPVGARGKQAQPWIASHGQSLDPTRLNWCGAYTNAFLAQNGIAGLPEKRGWIATNWAGYGEPVKDAPQANDVVVLTNGRADGQTGGHVGVATGETRVVNGTPQIQMKSGNAHDGRVSIDWVPATGAVVRRGMPFVPKNEATPAAQPEPPPQTAQTADNAVATPKY